jgi:hypothetical protein
MNKHRCTQDSVSKKPPPDNFQASDAIESLHAAILRVETLAQVAIDAVDPLRCPSDPADPVAREGLARTMRMFQLERLCNIAAPTRSCLGGRGEARRRHASPTT